MNIKHCNNCIHSNFWGSNKISFIHKFLWSLVTTTDWSDSCFKDYRIDKNPCGGIEDRMDLIVDRNKYNSEGKCKYYERK